MSWYHDLVHVDSAAWRALLATRIELASDPLVAGWVDRGWPLIRRHTAITDVHGVALGLPLPPLTAKRRLAFVVRREDIVATTPLPTLREARRVAPRQWWPALDALDELTARFAVETRVFGSLAWHALTGLPYLTPRSDLDLVMRVEPGTDVRGLLDGVAAIEAVAPMRLDAELRAREPACTSGAIAGWISRPARP